MQDYIQEKKLLSYDDVVPFSAGDSREPLVDVRTYDNAIITHYLKEDMLEITGDAIFVRNTLAQKLAAVNKILNKKSLGLKVVYGYRHPAVQTGYFVKRRTVLKDQYPELNDEALDRRYDRARLARFARLGHHRTVGGTL